METCKQPHLLALNQQQFNNIGANFMSYHTQCFFYISKNWRVTRLHITEGKTRGRVRACLLVGGSSLPQQQAVAPTHDRDPDCRLPSMQCTEKLEQVAVKFRVRQ